MLNRLFIDWFDKEGEVINNIDSKEVLIKEYEHVNKLLQQIYTNEARFTQWLYGAIILCLGAIFSILFKLRDVKSSITSDDLIILIIMVGVPSIFMLLFHKYTDYGNKKKLVLKKEKIIELINANSKDKENNKGA